MSDVEATFTRPVKQLVGFEKVWLKAGEAKEVQIQVTRDQLGYYNDKGEWFFEPGKFKFSAGGSSQTTQSLEIDIQSLSLGRTITPEF
jgi:beta-glucosidase